jgi:hypothetical protein
VTIDVLPDVALLKIFDSYVDEAQIEAWHTLVHVYQKWRNVVFGSPRRLNLQLYCKASTPVRKTLDVWPLLPILIWVDSHKTWGVDNIVAALEYNDRICTINLFHVRIPSSQMEEIVAALHRPFPALTGLDLQSRDETAPLDPDLFLGGSAPRLQTLHLNRISFPGLPKLLLSAPHLVDLDLWEIPHSGYFSVEAMITCLSVLIKLERLVIGFESPRSGPELRSQHLPLQTRALLPVLTWLRLRGVCECLEDLVAQIDAPLLDNLWITPFHQLIFDTPQLTQFISRSPKLKASKEAKVTFSYRNVSIILPQPFDRALKLGISCSRADWQLSSLAQICSSSFPRALIPVVEHLEIQSGSWRLHWQNDIENSQWLELFRPFAAVKDLYMSWEFTPLIAPALHELVGERVAEALPALRTLFLEEPLPSGPVQEAIRQFVAARQLAGHPIAVSHWRRK